MKFIRWANNYFFDADEIPLSVALFYYGTVSIFAVVGLIFIGLTITS